jgi:hypothetical protein
VQGILKESALPVKMAAITGNRTWQNQAMFGPVPTRFHSTITDELRAVSEDGRVYAVNYARVNAYLTLSIRLLVFLMALHFIWYPPNCVLADEEESTFRCGSTLIELGESNYRVLDKCGLPSAKEGVGAASSYASPPGVETWIYNRGPTDFVYRLKFQDGSLVNIYRGGRGF